MIPVSHIKIIIMIIIYGKLNGALFILGCSKELYTENKDNNIKHPNTVQIEVKEYFQNMVN